jgi:hypothetical protein
MIAGADSKAQGRPMESPESWFHRRATFYVEAQILFHLNQAGVLRALCERPLTPIELALALGLDPAVTEALLDYIFGVDDLLERDDEQRYALSDFGEQVLARYSDAEAEPDSRSINMFDVRVGAYGPVWRNLGAMLKGESRYGRDFHREGRYAENGVAKLARHFAPILCREIDRLGSGAALEVGTTTGLLGQLAEHRPGLTLYGLDKSRRALEQAGAALGVAASRTRLIHGDFFAIPEWAEQMEPEPHGLIFSLHFHEMLAEGTERLVAALRELRQRLPGWAMLALEQPRLPQAERSSLRETLWLYGQSNILIHHLVGNGRILSREGWASLAEEAGCDAITDTPCDYLGYRAFVFHL